MERLLPDRSLPAPQKPAMPVIGVLESGSATSATSISAEFHAGLKESGFVEGQNVTIEYRRAEAHMIGCRPLRLIWLADTSR